MNRIVKFIDKVLSVWCIFLVALLTFGVIVSVVLRYVFNISFVESEEGITLLFVATTYFGMALGVREKDHIAITYFADNAPPRVQTAIRIFIMMLIIIISAVVFRQSLIWIEKVGGIPSPAIHIPYKYFYVMVPISAAIMIFYALVDILAVFLPIEPARRGYETDDEIPGMNGGGPAV
jgi:TRAP-type C4-dicarboxylate transport system permease small subunit